MTKPAPATVGETLTRPRGLFIDFRNIFGRKINEEQVRSLTRNFMDVTRAVASRNLPVPVSQGERLVAEPVPGDKNSEKLVEGGLSADIKRLRVLRLHFSESVPGNDAPLSATLELDLRDREAKRASLIVHGPDTNAAQNAYDLYEQLEKLLNKGLLNRVDMRFTARDGSMSMGRTNQASSTFTLRF